MKSEEATDSRALDGSPDSGIHAPGIGLRRYYRGTLSYTFQGLTVLFLWLLWGDFAFNFFESIFVKFIPLYLRDLHASNTLIGIMTGSIAGLVNILFLPGISQWSDRYRGRLGRRIPFLYVVTPLTVASLIAVGFAPEIAGWLYGHLLSRLAPSVSKVSVILTLLCALAVLFHFFNMVLVNAFTWLVRDVVPDVVMARFLSWFRIVATMGMFAFLWFVFPHIIVDRKAVCVGIGVFYLIAFFSMCRNVREGQYPPPPQEKQPGILGNFLLYFRQALTIPLYRNFFLTIFLTRTANCILPFLVLFTRSIPGLTMDDIGRLFAWGSLASAVSYYPVGWLCDRFSPMRVTPVALGLLTILSALAGFLVNNRESLLIYTIVIAGPAVGWELGSQAAAMKLFPEQKFAQFSSAVSVFGCGSLIIGNFCIGKFIDLVHSNYQLIFLWSSAFFLVSLYPIFSVYRNWKEHGGPDNYMAPVPASHGD